ncbi:MAG: hypothetical protein K0R38_874 [Polyangiaceae bacterium]|nr:hypothetical protein [Polyangiaceae bacterium]
MAKFPTAVALALTIAAALGACSRVSSPPPAADTAVAPSPPVARTTGAAPTEPSNSAAEPSNSAAEPSNSAAEPSNSAVAAPVASEGASPWTAASDCSDKSADARTRATCEAKEEFRAFVASHQSCASAADCTIVTGSCPFGCFVPVTKASRAETLAKLGALGDRLDKAGHRCVYRCMSPPGEACVAGRCSASAADSK